MEPTRGNRLQQRSALSQKQSLQTARNALVTGIALAVIFLTNYDVGNSDAGLIRLEGIDGAATITTADSVLNQYAILNTDATAGATSVIITDINDLDNGSALAAGDLVMIMQMQGATINVSNDTSYGRVTDYGSAGKYEFAYVAGIASNTINLRCGLQNSYYTSGNTQVIRVPQYTTLTINSGASVTAPAWDGSTGGVVVVVAENTVNLDGTGTIDVAGKGFRGGTRHNSATYAIYSYYSSTASHGGEKGEGIAGYQTEYDALGGRYGRGAPANGGGGGNAHNAGGGGGSNAHNGIVWNGQGNMCSSCTGSSAWALDSAYYRHGNALTTSSGGGRGGYSYGSSNKDALVDRPTTGGWGGDSRREIGGLGGRPLQIDPSERLFLGGGGGSGSGNNNASTDGADGGGLIMLFAGTVSGSGTLNAKGADAGSTTSSHNDAPGGGGGGGTIVIKANTVSGLTAQADGGLGGDQLITGNESEGPGGGGGGGYIALPSGTRITTSMLGASAGTTTSSSLTEFPSNGATDGGDGQLGTTDHIPFCSTPDADQDGVADADDYDDDNDGIPDWEEAGCSSLADFESGACADPSATNSNGVPNYMDASFCSGGALVNGVCPEYDSDGDGIPDFLDKDSDQDGLPDLIEAGGVDEDGDGNVDCYSASTAQYTVMLTVTDDNGATRTTYETISLGTNPPQATYSATPGSGVSWDQVSFDANGSSDDGSISAYNWDLGDGNTSTSSSFSHTYAGEGTYTVVLTVTDNDGLQDTYTQWVTLYENGGCTPNTGGVYWEAYTSISGSNLSDLTGNAKYPDSPDDSSYLTTLVGPNEYGSNFGDRTRGYIYPPATGDYTFEIYGDDDSYFYLSTDETEGNLQTLCYVDGWTSANQWTKYSSQQSSATSLVSGNAYYFEVLHKEGGGGDHWGVRWTRPDNGVTEVIDGAYLSAYGAGCSNVRPAPQISASVVTGSSPLSVVFNASSSSDYDGTISSYAWDFGDGNTGTGVAASHTFTAPNALTDTDGDGWCDTYDNATNGGSGYSSGTPISVKDSDEDGIDDYLDLDADNDGLPDLLESGGIDSDGDGRLDSFTDADDDGFDDSLDPDDDGVMGIDTGEDTDPLILTNSSGVVLGNGSFPVNNDGDNLANYVDLDSDDDGLPDILEAEGTDTNGDGRVDSFTDTDGDGYDDTYDTDDNTVAGSGDGGIALAKTSTDINSDQKWGDTETITSGVDISLDSDADQYLDWLDRDADNDGIPDLIEAGGTDSNGDGKIDAITDADRDGFMDLYDSDADNDGSIDASANSLYLDDTNSDNTVESGSVRTLYDSDQDGIPNHLDLDADNDGIYDIVEAGLAAQDADSSGQIGTHGASFTDADADGLADVVDASIEVNSGSTGTPAIRTGSADAQGWPTSYATGDQDNDALLNHLDIDADADGIADWLEAQPSGNASPTDGLQAPTGVDSDGDGIDDGFDILDQTNGGSLSGTFLDPINTDGDALSDYLDENSDGDPYDDVVEGHDADQDGHADRSPSGVDSDQDGLDDIFDTVARTAGDYSSTNAMGSSAPVQDSNSDMGSGGDRDWRDVSGGNFPVEWVSFTAELLNGDGILEWITATELNSDYFSVERSVDGIEFNSVGQVEAAGTTLEMQTYTFRDPAIDQLGQQALLYRLRQVDIDGSFEYSNMVEVQMDGSLGRDQLSVFPNPARDLATIRLQTQEAGSWQLEVMSINGQTIQAQRVETLGGATMIELNVSDWASGYYIVRLRQGSKNLTQKLSVQ